MVNRHCSTFTLDHSYKCGIRHIVNSSSHTDTMYRATNRLRVVMVYSCVKFPARWCIGLICVMAYDLCSMQMHPCSICRIRWIDDFAESSDENAVHSNRCQWECIYTASCTSETKLLREKWKINRLICALHWCKYVEKSGVIWWRLQLFPNVIIFNFTCECCLTLTYCAA